jgi:flagellar motor protein MotB
MSDKNDKPADFDPDATVMQPRARPADEPKHDPDATVMMGSRKDLVAPDEDATVMIRPGAMGGGDEDATVMMPAGLGKGEPPGEVQQRVPMAAFQRDDDPDATVIGAPAAEREPDPVPVAVAAVAVVQGATAAATAVPELSTPVSADTSRMPLVAGGLVVVAVALYLVFGGGKPPPPAEPKAEVAAIPAPASAPAAAATSAPAGVVAPTPAVPGTPAVKDVLAAQLKSGAIAVAEEGGVTTIALTGTNQFASGSVDIEAKHIPAVLAIAAALDKVPGSIFVTGHADAKPSSNPKFPSNQELSAARGASVAKVIAGKLRDPKRVKGEGAGDSMQVAPSDTAENRAKNRRVVIVLRPAS